MYHCSRTLGLFFFYFLFSIHFIHCSLVKFSRSLASHISVSLVSKFNFEHVHVGGCDSDFDFLRSTHTLATDEYARFELDVDPKCTRSKLDLLFSCDLRFVVRNSTGWFILHRFRPVKNWLNGTTHHTHNHLEVRMRNHIEFIACVYSLIERCATRWEIPTEPANSVGLLLWPVKCG